MRYIIAPLYPKFDNFNVEYLNNTESTINIDCLSLTNTVLTQAISYVNSMNNNNAIIPLDVCLCIVDEEEIRTLNNKFRHKDYATNVLSFPSGVLDLLKDCIVHHDLNFRANIGDIILCYSIICKEALEQSKTIEAHYCHMIAHSFLHLLGYDHENEEEAQIMESLEVEILKNIGYNNPYCPN